jgi:3-polyprenyl-4-hydroxybenzoate decarboxylase
MAETKLRKPVPRAAPAAVAAPSAGDNRPSPIRTLRDWLDHLAARDRLAVIKPRVGLRFELTAAKRPDGRKAVVVPRPGGHAIPVASACVPARRRWTWAGRSWAGIGATLLPSRAR